MIPLPDMSRGRVSYTNDLLRDILELSFWMDVSSTIMTTSRRREREREDLASNASMLDFYCPILGICAFSYWTTCVDFLHAFEVDDRGF